jgi:hypothetical protein
VTIPFDAFPRLTPGNHRITSPATTDYNCVAWSAGDTQRWWQPGRHWPVETPAGDYGIGVLVRAFEALDYTGCELDASLEPGFEKVALYGDSSFYTHAARQLETGNLTSKLGALVDIEHETPDDVTGGDYGEVVQIMKRKVSVATTSIASVSESQQGPEADRAQPPETQDPAQPRNGPATDHLPVQ